MVLGKMRVSLDLTNCTEMSDSLYPGAVAIIGKRQF